MFKLSESMSENFTGGSHLRQAGTLSEKELLASYGLSPEDVALTPEQIENLLPHGEELAIIERKFAEHGMNI